MNYSLIMCFSSSIICLLLVTSHGSTVPTHRRMPQHDGNYSLHNSSKNAGNVSHLFKSHKKANISQSDVLVPYPSKIAASNNFQITRRQRSADDFEIRLPPVPGKEEASSTLSSPGSYQKPTISVNEAGKVPELNLHHENNYLHSNTSELLAKNDDRHSSRSEKQSTVICANRHHHNHHHESSDPHHKDDHHHSDSDHHSESEDLQNNHSGETLCDNHSDLKNSSVAESHQHQPTSPSPQSISGRVWVYSVLAVVAISLCGLLSVAVIPIMQKWFYHTLLQFLVGLAVGSLSGDGLLHLMPHAILDGEISHDHGDHGHSTGFSLKSMERTAIWRGLAALGGIFLFFVAERLLGILTAYKKQKKEAMLSRIPKNVVPVLQKEEGANNGNVGEKLAQPKKNSYDHIREKDEKETMQMLQTEGTPSRKGSVQSTHEVGFHGRSSFSLEPEMSVTYRPDSESSVIVSDHHGHSHGHRHDIPQSVTAVAWMVIMGDGLHNFCDGLAIGAAFASGDADGISTTVAVFCHELPHELGDFAMLLKTGMKVKQALFYNGISSVLCFFGMIIGVLLGNVHSATSWVFAGTAGMFLYIALVDMLPELTTSKESGLAAISTLVVQVLGIAIGICIMLLIAFYEHELRSIVS